MSAPRFTVFFSGTDMTWEDTAVFLQLGAKQRHNLHETNPKHCYYMFDGPSAAISDQHKPVENLVFDKEQKDDFMRSSPRKIMNAFGYRFRWAMGKGTNHIATAAYELIRERIVTHGIREIDLTGFSRGGNIALIVGALLNKLEVDLKGKLSPDAIKSIKVNIYAIDPVAGKGRNKEAFKYGALSQFVKKCVVGLATNESLPAFHPRDILSDMHRYNVQFTPATEYVFLPFPDDHAMCVQWMKDIVRSQIHKDSELLSPCDEKRMIYRRLGLPEVKPEVKWIDRIDETRAYRLVHFVKFKQKYSRNILPQDEKLGVELFFQHVDTQQAHYNIDHTSFQNDADSVTKGRTFEGHEIGGLHPKTKSTQQKFARKNHDSKYRKMGFRDRACKEKIAEYKNHIFVNLLHEAMFAKHYPNLHQFMLHCDVKDLDNAVLEFDAISGEKYLFTKAYIENALMEKIRLHPITHFKSTNMHSLKDILNLVRSDAKESKESKVELKTEVVSIAAKVEGFEVSSCIKDFLHFKFFKLTDVGESKIKSLTVAPAVFSKNP